MLTNCINHFGLDSLWNNAAIRAGTILAAFDFEHAIRGRLGWLDQAKQLKQGLAPSKALQLHIVALHRAMLRRVRR